ncbi:hypothetical protein Q3G72_013961 [Acer saccharum]|nr:hypothetical protein Q3G72_013961 [Acer saccharum]
MEQPTAEPETEMDHVIVEQPQSYMHYVSRNNQLQWIEQPTAMPHIVVEQPQVVVQSPPQVFDHACGA